MQRVINFSGGKTSAYMTIHEYREGDLVIFCDTGREHEKTYKFINDFEAYENIPITRLKYYNEEKPFDALLARKKVEQTTKPLIYNEKIKNLENSKKNSKKKKKNSFPENQEF